MKKTVNKLFLFNHIINMVIGACLFLILFFYSAVAVTAKNEISRVTTKAVPVYDKGIQLSWEFRTDKEVKITEWRVYRSLLDDPYFDKHKKLIATVDSEEMSYLDETAEKGITYIYWVWGYLVKDNTETKIVDDDWSSGGAYMDVPWFTPDDYVMPWDTTVNSASISFSEVYRGYTPSGYEIYRKAKGEKQYILIADIPNTDPDNWVVMYTDWLIKKDVKYYYKMRAYLDTGEKRLYGKFSHLISRVPGNGSGIYQVEAVSPTKGKIKTLTVHITSDSDNGDLYYTNYDYSYSAPVITVIPAGKDDYKDDKAFSLKAVKFSRDGKKWKKFGKKKVVLKGGEEMWIKFQHIKKKRFKLPKKFKVTGNVSYKDIVWSEFEYLSGSGNMTTDFFGDAYY